MKHVSTSSTSSTSTTACKSEPVPDPEQKKNSNTTPSVSNDGASNKDIDNDRNSTTHPFISIIVSCLLVHLASYTSSYIYIYMCSPWGVKGFLQSVAMQGSTTCNGLRTLSNLCDNQALGVITVFFAMISRALPRFLE